MTEKQPTYNEAAQRLEAIVATLERGGLGLDETLKLYEEGAALLKTCQAELVAAEGRLNELRLEDLEQELQTQEAENQD
ncbi:MAG: exodeoxyribonuclease VII small subunit [Candidatus Poseidoniaceae archaeon]|nr:exodeoxyribonuclease VII small subunit [Candidatus Poseidoniaceae archaeon]